jgi:hypothetical protein
VAQDSRRLMDAIVAAVVTAVLGGFGGYLWGNRRLRHERLYDRRADVLSRLGELLYEVQRGFVTFTKPFQSSEVDRKEQMEEANRAFFELIHHFYSNEMWLDPETCLKVEKFTEFAYLKVGEYVDDLDERGYPQTPEGRALGREIMREIQPLRRELIAEFRAIVYPPPWYEPPLRILERLERRDANESSAAASSDPPTEQR